MPKVRTPQNDAERIIQAYNRACGGCMRLDNPTNVQTANTLIAVTKSAEDVINATAVYADEMKTPSNCTFVGFAVWYRKQGGKRKAEATPEPQQKPAEYAPAVPKKPYISSAVLQEQDEELRRDSEHAVSRSELAAAMTVLASSVSRAVGDISYDRIKDTVIENVKGFVRDTYGVIHRDVFVSVNGGEERKVEGVLHEKFDTVLRYVKMDEPVFLVGAAGSGKNFLCKQVADALGMKFWFTNAVTQAYQVTGFTDAMGRFQQTQFYQAFTEGGLFMLDEMDASIPEVLIILNAAIANRYFDFPAPIGRVEAHKDFRVIAAGNTYGQGADADYVGRNQLDAASLDRFAVVEIHYDAKIEEACANGNSLLLTFCRAFRDATIKAGIHTVVSYRTINRMSKALAAGMDTYTAVKTGIVKSLCKDDLNAILPELGSYGTYSDVLRRIAREL